MKFSWRAVLCAVVMVGATGAFKACNSDGPSSGGEDPPVTADDRFDQLPPTGVSALKVLDNDTKLDNPPLTYTIEDSPSVGSAAFNSDNTVALTLPSGFKGLTKFRYKVTNSKGGFSISSVTVFVDMPAYRALFAAKGTSGTYEIYVSDFISSTKISSAVSGNLRLQNMWKSENGSLVAYERADPAQISSTTELFFVKPTSNPSPVKFPNVAGRSFISGAPVVIDDGSRYLAYPMNPSGSGTTTPSLYVLDSSNSGSATAVGSSTGVSTAFTQWVGSQNPQLYFVAPPTASSTSHTLFRASPTALDAPQRISPVYQSADQERAVFVSPNGDRVLIVGTHNGQSGAFFIDPTDPNVERRLTLDIPSGASIESYRTDENVTQLVYTWRVTGSTTARLSVVDINSSDTPQTVFQGNLLGFSDLRPDGLAALITRGTGSAGSDGTLYEYMLDGSANSLIAPNVTGGVYADGDIVYLYSRTLTPSVIQRANFERTPDPLFKSTTPAGALFVSPIFQPTAAILEDSTATTGVVLVNAAAPGKTLKFTDLQIGSIPNSTLLPTLIGTN